MRSLLFAICCFFMLAMPSYAFVNLNNAGKFYGELQSTGTNDIALDSDEVALKITANSTQTSDLVQMFGSDGTTKWFSFLKDSGNNRRQFHIYGSYTDASNYERLQIEHRPGDDATILTQAAGSGTARGLIVGIVGGGTLDLASTFGTFKIGPTGVMAFDVNNFRPGSSGIDLGREADKWDNIYLDGDAFLYNSFTDASNYERGFVRWDTNRYEIGTEKLGTGTARDMLFMRNGEDKLRIGDTAITTVVDILPISDDTKDLGSSGSSWKDVYIDGQIINGGSAPVVSACGTSPSITGGDTAGKVTIGSGTPSSCTVTFDTAYSNAPSCTITGSDDANAYGATTTTTALTISSNSEMSDDVIMYQCIGL